MNVVNWAIIWKFLMSNFKSSFTEAFSSAKLLAGIFSYFSLNLLRIWVLNSSLILGKLVIFDAAVVRCPSWLSLFTATYCLSFLNVTIWKLSKWVLKPQLVLLLLTTRKIKTGDKTEQLEVKHCTVLMVIVIISHFIFFTWRDIALFTHQAKERNTEKYRRLKNV